MSEFTDLLTQHVQGVCRLSGSQLETLEHHYELLLLWNKRISLTSVRGAKDFVIRHYCESLALGTHLPDRSTSVVDIGSGAGFPGLPMGALRPDCQFTLVESNGKKAVFLREATRNLPNVRIAAQRAESLQSRFDWVVSRAIHWKKLLPLLSRLGDYVGLLIGESDAEELRRTPGIQWAAPVRLPWGERRMILTGSVPRGTC